MQVANPSQGLFPGLSAKGAPSRPAQASASQPAKKAPDFGLEFAMAQAAAATAAPDVSPDATPAKAEPEAPVAQIPKAEKPTTEDATLPAEEAAAAAAVMSALTAPPALDASTAPEDISAPTQALSVEPVMTNHDWDVPANEGITILERPAADAAEANPAPVLPNLSEGTEKQASTEAVMDDQPEAQAPLTPRGVRVQEDSLARMPVEIPIVSFERDRADDKNARLVSSSLENEDAEQLPPPPPSRVEVGPVAAKRQDVPDAQVKPGPAKQAEPEEGPVLQGAKEAAFALPKEESEPVPAPALQVADEIEIQQAMGRAQFTMKLKPESLGEVTVRLTMVGDEISARIITRSEGARAAILTELGTLGDAMIKKGIDIRSVEVLSGSMEHASLLSDNGRQNGQFHGGKRHKGSNIPTVEAVEAAQQTYDLYLTDTLADDAGVEVHA